MVTSFSRLVLQLFWAILSRMVGVRRPVCDPVAKVEFLDFVDFVVSFFVYTSIKDGFFVILFLLLFLLFLYVSLSIICNIVFLFFFVYY